MTETRLHPGKNVRFTWVDLVITVLLMALTVTVTGLTVVSVREARKASGEVTCCLTATDLPAAAAGKITKGETLFLPDGTPLGTVRSVSYQRPDGSTLQLTVYLQANTVREYGGYRTGDTLLTVGECYHLQNKAYGGWLLCENITENGGK